MSSINRTVSTIKLVKQKANKIKKVDFLELEVEVQGIKLQKCQKKVKIYFLLIFQLPFRLS